MICVKVKSEDNRVTSVSILGHAMYEDYGKDIVCSAVSAIVITTVNGIYRVNNQYLSVEQKKDGLILSIHHEDDVLDQFILNMLDLLTQLSHDYPKNVEIK